MLMDTNSRKRRLVIVHIGVLIAMTTFTNAAALMPSLFEHGTVVASGIATLMVAGIEPIIRGRLAGTLIRGLLTGRDKDVLRIHAMACILAAIVGTVCAGVAMMRSVS